MIKLYLTSCQYQLNPLVPKRTKMYVFGVQQLTPKDNRQTWSVCFKCERAIKFRI